MSISGEESSAFTFSTRGSFGLLTPPACPMRSGTGSERLIQAVLPGQRSRPDPDGLRLRDSGCLVGPRADRPIAAALGAVSQPAYFIWTCSISSGLGPEQTARTLLPSGQFPGWRTSLGLGPQADHPNAGLRGGPRDISPAGLCSRPGVQGWRRAVLSCPIRNCSHTHRPVVL